MSSPGGGKGVKQELVVLTVPAGGPAALLVGLAAELGGWVAGGLDSGLSSGRVGGQAIGRADGLVGV